jgi:TolB protein
MRGRGKMKRLVTWCVLLTTLICLLLSSISCNTTRAAKIAFLGKIDETRDWPYFSMNEDGSNQIKLADKHNWHAAADPRQLWSRNARLAYIEYVGEEPTAWLCVVDADGSNRRQLMDITGLHQVNISMAPDGNTVLLIYQAPRRLEVPHEGHIDIQTIYVRDIYAVDVATGAVKQLTDTPDIKEERAVFSPDGKKIAFIGRTDDPYTNLNIYVMDAGGSNLRRLTDYRMSELLNSIPLYWSPDGKKILAVPDTVMLSDIEYYTDICLIDVASGSSINLTNSPNTDDFNPSWSPDGKKIAFCSGNSTDSYHICVMDANEGNVIELYNSSSAPSWLPDGKGILFSDGLNINVMDADGKNLKTLAEGGGTYGSIAYPIWLSH